VRTPPPPWCYAHHTGDCACVPAERAPSTISEATRSALEEVLTPVKVRAACLCVSIDTFGIKPKVPAAPFSGLLHYPLCNAHDRGQVYAL
jgi:hypothetical protein